MRRILSLLLAFLLLCGLCAFPAGAEQAGGVREYTVDGFDLKVSLPLSFNAAWRGMTAEEDSIAAMETTFEAVSRVFGKQPTLLLFAMRGDFQRELFIGLDEVSYADTRDQATEDLVRFVKAIETPMYEAENDLHESRFRIVETTNNKYIQHTAVCPSDREMPYAASIYTNRDGKSLAVMCYSATPFSEDDLEEMKRIACSFVMGGEAQEFVRETEWFSGEDLGTTEYTSGSMRFVLPENLIVLDRNTPGDSMLLTGLKMDPDTVTDVLDIESGAFSIEKYGSGLNTYFRVSDSSDALNFLPENQEDVTAFVQRAKEMYEEEFGMGNVSVDLISGKIEGSGAADELIWVKVKLENAMGYQVSYLTSIDGKAYTLFVQSEKKPVSAQDEKEADEIIRNSTYLRP